MPETTLNYDAKARIARDVILGVPAPPDDPEEAKAWRQEIQKSADEARLNGHMLDLPFDWEHNE